MLQAKFDIGKIVPSTIYMEKYNLGTRIIRSEQISPLPGLGPELKEFKKQWFKKYSTYIN